MISKFGRVIDLEALQTLSVNTTLEELKIKKLRKELSNAKEIRMWEVGAGKRPWGKGSYKIPEGLLHSLQGPALLLY